MSAESKAVEVTGLTKRFGSFTAVDNVSFDVPDGEMFGYLGPNGAGKTTLMRMLTTLIIPTSGSAKIAGFDVVTNPADVRRQIGVISQAMTSVWILPAMRTWISMGVSMGFLRGKEKSGSSTSWIWSG